MAVFHFTPWRVSPSTKLLTISGRLGGALANLGVTHFVISPTYIYFASRFFFFSYLSIDYATQRFGKIASFETKTQILPNRATSFFSLFRRVFDGRFRVV